MGKNRFLAMLPIGLFLAALILATGCKVNVKKEQNGEDKQVDIKTLVGGIHVSQQANISDVGVAIYPGARVKEKSSDGSDKSANVNISGFGFALKVIAIEYESDDAPAKVLAFYKDQLKRYGSVLECHSSSHFTVNTNMGSHDSKNDSNDLTCEGNHGSNVELKVGTKNDQHIVAVEPQGNGSSFSLVYVHTRGKDADI